MARESKTCVLVMVGIHWLLLLLLPCRSRFKLLLLLLFLLRPL